MSCLNFMLLISHGNPGSHLLHVQMIFPTFSYVSFKLDLRD